MRFVILKDHNYFSCSTLPLLNGDIKVIVDDYYLNNAKRDLNNLFVKIENFLIDELFDMIAASNLSNVSNWKLRKEYKRMIKLYKFRIEQLQHGRIL